MPETVRRCAFPGCDQAIEPIAGGAPRKYCSAEHSMAARRRRLRARAEEAAAQDGPAATAELPSSAGDDERAAAAEPVVPAVAGSTATRRSRSRRRMAVGAAVLLGALAAGLIVFRLTGSDEPAVAAASAQPPAPAPATSTTTTSLSPSTVATPSPVEVSTPMTTIRTTTTLPKAPPPAPAAAAVAPVKVGTIEDTHAGMVAYSGASWTKCGGCNVATADDSYHYAYQVGDSYTLRFQGRQLAVFAPSDNHGGIAQIRVDGAGAGLVDFYTAGTPLNGLRWKSAVLPDGTHDVTFTIVGSTSSDANVELFDHADVYA